VPERLYLPRGNLVVSAEGLVIATEAAGISASITTSVSATESSTGVEAASIAEATTNAVVGLVIGAVMPLDVLRILRLKLLEEARNVLLGLDQDLAEVLADVVITVVEEGSSLALVADASSATDTVDVLGDAVVLSGGHIIVDDMLDIGDVETAGRDTGGDHDRTFTGTE
jgi:hypothetical protein